MRPGPDGWPPPEEMVAKFEEIWNSDALTRRVGRVMGVILTTLPERGIRRLPSA